MQENTDRPDGTPRTASQSTLGEFLRGKPGLRTLRGDEGIRRRLALMAGPTLLDGSALQACIEAGHVSEDTLPVLLAAVELRHLSEAFEDVEGTSISNAIRRTREGLAAAAKLADADWPGTGVMMDETDPDMEAFETVDGRLAELESRARTAEEAVHKARCQFDPATGHLETRPGPDGGHPRRALRDLVQALLQVYDGPLRNDRDLRTWVARELASLFSADLLGEDTLRDTIDNAVKALRGG